MTKYVLDGLYADSYRPLAHSALNTIVSYGVKERIGYGVRVLVKKTPFDEIVQIKSRIPNIAMWANIEGESELYNMVIGGGTGDSVIAPFIPLNLFFPAGFNYIVHAQVTPIGKHKALTMIRATGVDAGYAAFLLVDQETMSARCLNDGAAFHVIRASVGANTLYMMLEPLGEFTAGGDIYTLVWYRSFDTGKDTMKLIKTAAADNHPGLVNVWPYSDDYVVTALCSVAPGVLAILAYVQDPVTPLDLEPFLLIRNMYTATNIRNVKVKDIDPRYVPYVPSGGAATNYPEIDWNARVVTTDFGTLIAVFQMNDPEDPVEAGIKAFKSTDGGATWAEVYHAAGELYLMGNLQIFNEPAVVSLGTGNVMFITSDHPWLFTNPTLHVTNDHGATWETRNVTTELFATFGYPWGATPSGYEPDETGKLVPTQWSWGDYTPDGKYYVKTFSSVVPTEETMLSEVPVVGHGLDTGLSAKLPCLAYTGGDLDHRIPLKPGLDGVLEV